VKYTCEMGSWEDSDDWPEITNLAQEKGGQQVVSHELHLSGAEISSRLAANEGRLPDQLFEHAALNYLEITETSLAQVPPAIASLTNLINLALHRNRIETVAMEISRLEKLKFVDLSYNKLSEIPASFCELPVLHTLNLGNNMLTSVPDVSKLKQLGKFFLDHNKLSTLPDGLCQLSNVSELYAQGNTISEIPTDIRQMSLALKVLDMSENTLTHLPVELAACGKLRCGELNMTNNPIKDNRLKKMLNQGIKAKAVLEYLEKNSAGGGGGGGKKGGKGKKKGGGGEEEQKEEAKRDEPMIHILHIEDDDRRVIVKPSATSVRQYVVCTIVRNLDLSEPAVFKKFLAIQTKLHENECDMRTKATIATHSLKSLAFPLHYEALPPTEVNVIGLGRSESTSALQLIENLKEEREQAKLKKKRQPKTGLFKFIDLVDGAPEVCCLRDASGEVISFPPITNSEKTKISPSIEDVLLEVTSPESLPFCKSVMEALISQMFLAGFKSHCEVVPPPSDDDTDAEGPGTKLNGLVFEQLRVTDHELNLRVVFPSKTDLDGPEQGFQVERMKNLAIK